MGKVDYLYNEISVTGTVSRRESWHFVRKVVGGCKVQDKKERATRQLASRRSLGIGGAENTVKARAALANVDISL